MMYLLLLNSDSLGYENILMFRLLRLSSYTIGTYGTMSDKAPDRLESLAPGQIYDLDSNEYIEKLIRYKYLTA